MSKIFYDHFIELEDIKSFVDMASEDYEEKEDLWNLVDEFVNHKVLITILTNLDAEYHDEFLQMFLDKPYDNGLTGYLDDKLTCPLCDLIGETQLKIKEELEDIFEIRFVNKKYKRLLKRANK